MSHLPGIRRMPLLVVMILLPVLLLPGRAEATSYYDGVVKTSEELLLDPWGPREDCYTNLSTSWATELRQDLSVAALDSFDNHRAAWAVTSVWAVEEYDSDATVHPPQVPSTIYVYWWEAADIPDHASFVPLANNRGAVTAPRATWIGRITMDEECTISSWAMQSYPNQHATLATSYRTADRFKPFLVHGFDVEYPSGYEGELIPGSYTPGPAKYVAMGDSFASGEANPDFELGTDEPGNMCHRSPKAFARLIEVRADPGKTAFVACAGAETWHAENGMNGEDPQVDSLSSSTEVVTLSIGGNDVGFKDYVVDCVIAAANSASCGSGTTPYSTVMGNINAASFETDLESLYSKILTDAPTAQVYVVDYPYISDASGSDACAGGDLSGARAVQVALNTVIADAVSDVASSRLHYVDTNVSGSPFADKHLCTSNSAGSSFVGLTAYNWEHSFHPNHRGHQNYRDLLVPLIY